MSAPSLDILAFAAHPDDAEIGCGGSLILAADQGLRVGVADLTDGENATRGTPDLRAREAHRASELLGLAERVSVGLPDTRLGADPAHRDAVADVIRVARPRIVLAPFYEDRHPDHAAAGRLVREARFDAGVGTEASRSPTRPERLYFYMVHYPFEPSFVVDIGSVWERKLAVLQAYSSQFSSGSDWPNTELSGPAFMSFLEARAIYHGAMIGAPFGEAFFALGPLAAAGIPDSSDGRPGTDAAPGYSVY